MADVVAFGDDPRDAIRIIQGIQIYNAGESKKMVDGGKHGE